MGTSGPVRVPGGFQEFKSDSISFFFKKTGKNYLPGQGFKFVGIFFEILDFFCILWYIF
jgi:hypothetical protein